MKISMETLVKAPVNEAWAVWNDPKGIMQRNTSGGNWDAADSTVELSEADKLLARMEAIDSSMGFDFDAFSGLL